MDLRKKFSYVSRRTKNYNDVDSGGSEVEDNDGNIVYTDTLGKEFVIKPNPKLKTYKDLFTNLLHTQFVKTDFPILSMMITHDNTMAITVSKQSEYQSWIKMYELATGDKIFEELLGGDPNQYIKAEEIAQNNSGTQYAVTYSDDGKFRLRTFGKKMRTAKEIKDSEVLINEIIELDDYSMCHHELSHPNITCCFLTDNLIFINFFHNHSLTHFHFIYNIANKRFIGDSEGYLVSKTMDCTSKNFP